MSGRLLLLGVGDALLLATLFSGGGLVSVLSGCDLGVVWLLPRSVPPVCVGDLLLLVKVPCVGEIM